MKKTKYEYGPRSAIASWLFGLSDSLPQPLSEAEKRVCFLLALGYSNNEAAEALQLSRRTIESQLSAAYSKLGVKGDREAIAKLLEIAATEFLRG